MGTGVDRITVAARLTGSWLSNPNTRATVVEVTHFFSSIINMVDQVAAGDCSAVQSTNGPLQTPAVSVRKSLANPEYIISLIDGRPYKMLRRHLRKHGLTPDEYRRRFGLKPDYPMVSETYSEVRRALAQQPRSRRRRSQNKSANDNSGVSRTAIKR